MLGCCEYNSHLQSIGTLIRKMKIVVLIIMLCGAISGDIVDIIKPSREYLPPSREYLPPLLPEYLQFPPETSIYVQDPPENSASSTLDNTILEEETYIPVQVVIDSSSDSSSRLRQYLPPLTVFATEKTIENDLTTAQTISNEDEKDPPTSYSIQTREFIETTTTDIIPEADREDTTPKNIPTKGTTPEESYNEEYTEVSKNSELKETTKPANAGPITTESIVSTTEFASVDNVTTEDDSIIIQTLSNTESILTTTTTVTDAIQNISTTESIPTTTVIATSSSVDTVTESDTDSIPTASTSDSIATTTADSASVNTESNTAATQNVYITEGAPTTTTFTPVDIYTTESDPLNVQMFSTTIPEYIQNAQTYQVATEQSTSETNESVPSNEATSELTVPQSDVSTPETLLLEDGYHYSIPSISFGSLNK